MLKSITKTEFTPKESENRRMRMIRAPQREMTPDQVYQVQQSKKRLLEKELLVRTDERLHEMITSHQRTERQACLKQDHFKQQF
jgi:hypothetical protein